MTSLLCVALAALLLPVWRVHSAAGGSAAAYLAQHNSKFLQMLQAVSVNDTALARIRGILLAPSNSAVDAFATSMGMPLQQLLQNKLLVDQVVAYHFLPGVRVTADLKLPRLPLLTRTAEVNFVVRFYKDAKTGRAWLQDMQGNNVTLRQPPVYFGNLTIVPVDKVLMSGGYYASLEAALKLQPQFQQAYKLYERAGGLGSSAAPSDITVFAPVNDAFKGTKVSVSSLSKDEARKLLQYHALPGGALQVSQLKPGIKATMLAGSNVKVDAGIDGTLKLPWSAGQTIPKPRVTVTDAAGQQAGVTVYNIWVGKGVLHGINGILQPSAASKAQGHRRALLQHLFADWQQHVLNHGHSIVKTMARRTLLQDYNPTSHFNGQWGHDNPASALEAMNTVGAAYAAQANYENAYYSLPDSPGWAPMNQWSSWESNA